VLRALLDIHRPMPREVIHQLHLEWAIHRALWPLAIQGATCLAPGATPRPVAILHRLNLLATSRLSNLAILDHTLLDQQAALMAASRMHHANISSLSIRSAT